MLKHNRLEGERKMATEYQIENRKLCIKLDGELDHHMAEKVRHQCEIILKSYPIQDIEFDFEKSDFMDSSGIGVILGRYKQIQPMGGKVYLSHMNDVIQRIVHMAGLEKLVIEI